ncbi:MAG: IS110 family transposase [Bryobacteraceae bacterium]|nr:IS110 family transposase [Bryobacteraceae bacterium]
MEIRTVGIDLGKTVFHVIGMDANGKIVLRKKLSRSQLLAWITNVPECLVGMEASCGAHHLGREIHKQGHEVRLIPAQFVRPFVKSQKNDYVDAEAIAEAVQRPTMRFVPIKSVEQLDLQAIHRVRERLIERRTSLINQLRAFLLERGITVRAGREWLRREIPALLVLVEQQLSGRISRLLTRMVEEWNSLDKDIDEIDSEIEAIAKSDEACQRLLTIPGVDPLSATAMIAAVGNGAAFTKGREFATWLGLVPQQCSTGGKPKLLGISKRGNEYLRRLFVHGARSVVNRVKRETLPFGEWITSLTLRSHSNVVSVAVANKLARIAWSVLSKHTRFQRSPITCASAA